MFKKEDDAPETARGKRRPFEYTKVDEQKAVKKMFTTSKYKSKIALHIPPCTLLGCPLVPRCKQL